MPHQCVRCGKIYEISSEQILKGCDACKGKFFFFIKEDELKQKITLPKLTEEQINEIERDVREIIGGEENQPIILDIETIRVLSPGKYSIDIIKLFKQNELIIYKIRDGKYRIDFTPIKREL